MLSLKNKPKFFKVLSKKINGQALHAKNLGFIHPTSK